MIPLGGAAETGAGCLPFKAIIHVAGISLLWRSSERSVRASVRNALAIARQRGYRSIAFPLIGAGSGGGKAERVLAWMQQELGSIEFDGEVCFATEEIQKVVAKLMLSAEFQGVALSIPQQFPEQFFGRSLFLPQLASPLFQSREIKSPAIVSLLFFTPSSVGRGPG